MNGEKLGCGQNAYALKRQRRTHFPKCEKSRTIYQDGKMVSHHTLCHRHNERLRRIDLCPLDSLCAKSPPLSRYPPRLPVDTRGLDLRFRCLLPLDGVSTKKRMAFHRHWRHRQNFLLFGIRILLVSRSTSIELSSECLQRFDLWNYFLLLGFQTPERCLVVALAKRRKHWCLNFRCRS